MKQAKAAVESNSGVQIETPHEGLVPAQGPKNLFIKVDTFNEEGREIGTRIVDMYHFGTRNWLQNHLWWAMHNKATVESQVAVQKDIDIYLMESKKALAEKFNAHVAA